METLDIILLLCFVPAIVTGLKKGFVEQLVSLVSIFVGVWAAFKFSVQLSGWLSSYIQTDPKILNIAAFAILVIIAVLLLNLVGKLITSTLKIASLGWANRLAGLVFAILKTAIVLGLLVFVFDSLNKNYAIFKPEVLDSSVIYTALRDLSVKVFPFLKELLSNVQADIH